MDDKNQQQYKTLGDIFEKAKKFHQENEPIYAECRNKVCFCTGECKRIIGYRKKSKHNGTIF